MCDEVQPLLGTPRLGRWDGMGCEEADGVNLQAMIEHEGTFELENWKTRNAER
jgi:hypothetical protein